MPGESYSADRAMPVFRDSHPQQVIEWNLKTVRVFINRNMKEQHHVRILLQRTGLTEIGECRCPSFTCL